VGHGGEAADIGAERGTWLIAKIDVPDARCNQRAVLSPLAAMIGAYVIAADIMDLLRKSGEFFYLKEDLDDEAEAANEGI
jgi:hypothetical protein